jgi:hypothetical protein
VVNGEEQQEENPAEAISREQLNVDGSKEWEVQVEEAGGNHASGPVEAKSQITPNKKPRHSTHAAKLSAVGTASRGLN